MIETITLFYVAYAILFLTLILITTVKQKPIVYAIICLTSLYFFSYSFFFYENVKGYPTTQEMIDMEPQVLYTLSNEEYVFYWVLEEGTEEPRVYKFEKNSEEEKAMREAQKLISEGKKVVMERKEEGYEDSGGVRIREAILSDLVTKE